MPNITASTVDALQLKGEALVTCRYNNYNTEIAKSNAKAIDPYSRVPSLPSLNEPLMVQNAMLAANNMLMGNGQATIMPPGVCFSFKIGFLCSLGFQIKVTLLPVNKVIWDNATWPTTPAVAPWQYKYWTVDKWMDGSLINVDDAQFADTGNLTPEQANYVKNSFQIKIELTPMTSITMADGTKYTEQWPAPGALAASSADVGNVNALNINTHAGTIGKGKATGPIKYTTVKGWELDKSRTSTMVFDVLVFNEKYYKRTNAEIFSNPSLSD